MDAQASPSQSPILPRRKADAASDSSSSNRVNRLGRYVVKGRLGQGGMGIVYEAEDTLLKRPVAVKLLPGEVSANPEALKRFLREAQSAAKLNHPNVVAIYDIGNSDGAHYIVMELVKGGSAQDFLRSRGRFSWSEATSVMIDVCRGVSAAHKAGLIHRDIKPANILRSADGTVKLGDFGLVKPVDCQATKYTQVGSVIGTPHYLSPEQGQGGRVDERSDIYSLGATYFALLTGQPPFPDKDPVQVMFAHCSRPIPDPRELCKEIPESCAAIIRKAMAKNRAERFADADSLLANLQAVVPATGTPDSVSGLATVPFAWRQADAAHSSTSCSIADVYPGERTTTNVLPTWKTPSRKMVGLGLGVVSLLLALVGVTLVLTSRPTAAPKEKNLFNRPTTPVTEKNLLVEGEDWSSLATAAQSAFRSRQAPELRRIAKQLQILQESAASAGTIVPREKLAETLDRMEKAAAFREKITEKGLVLSTSGLVSAVAFSPDDHWLVAANASADGGVLVWDSWSGVKHLTLGPPRNNIVNKVQAVAFSHDSKTLAAACADPVRLKLWQVDTGQERTLDDDKSIKSIHSLAFSPRVRSLVVGFESVRKGIGKTCAKIWDVDNNVELFVFKAEHRDKVMAVAYSAAAQQIVTGSHDTRVILWNADTGRIWRELHTGFHVQAVACDPRGGTLAVAGIDDQNAPWLQFWDYVGERSLKKLPLPHGACRCLAYSADASLLACGSGVQIVLWNADTYAPVATLSGHSLSVASIAFPNRGAILASGSDDQTLRLWDVTRFLPPQPKP